MAKKNYVVENGNKENDTMTQKGLSKLYHEKKAAKLRKAKLENEGVREDLMKWLFSGPENTEDTPLKD